MEGKKPSISLSVVAVQPQYCPGRKDEVEEGQTAQLVHGNAKETREGRRGGGGGAQAACGRKCQGGSE